MIGFIFFPFQSQHCAPKANASTACSLELCPCTKMHGQHVQHVNPFYPKPYVLWHHCKGIGLLLLHQQFCASLAPTCVHYRGDVGSGPFSIRKGPSHISHRTFLPPSWGDVGRWQVPLCSLFPPILGKAVLPCSGETPDSVGQQERTSKAVCVSAWGNSPGSGAAGDPAPAPRTVYVF